MFALTFSEHYAFFRERGVDWGARVGAQHPSVKDGMDARALFGVFTETLKGLEDPHARGTLWPTTASSMGAWVTWATSTW